MFFHNLARLTWRLDREEEPDRHSVRLVNFKFNDGDRLPPLTLELVWTESALRAVPGIVRPLTPLRMDDLLAEIEARDKLSRGAEIRRAQIADHLAGDARRVGATRLSELLERAVADGLIERLKEVREKPEKLLFAPDPAREPRAFRLSMSWEMGAKRGRMAGSFVAESKRQAIEYYRGIVQGLKPWSASAPKLPGDVGTTSPVASSEPPDFADPGREFGEASLPEG